MPFLMPAPAPNRRRTPKMGMQLSNKLHVIHTEPDNQEIGKVKPDKIYKNYTEYAVAMRNGVKPINSIYENHANVQDSFRKYRIKKLKIMHPISEAQSRWFIDIFEEYDFLLDIEKKRKIAALHISSPVNVSRWNNENDWYIHEKWDGSGGR